MRLLALDTATEACSAAVIDGDRLVTRYEEPRRGHAELILPMVRAVLREADLELADLDAIAVGRGPGGFTGVRIAISVAQGLAFGSGKPVVPVSDLAALAQRAVEESAATRVLACIDARMSEVYWGEFRVAEDNLVIPCGEERVTAANEVRIEAAGEWWAAGTGWAVPALAALAPAATTNARLLPRAREIALLARRDFAQGRAVSPELALPVYLRDRVATPPAPKQQ